MTGAAGRACAARRTSRVAAAAERIWPTPGGRSCGRAAARSRPAPETRSRRWRERLVAPVVTTYSARGLLPPAHPCAVGLPPHLPEVGALWDEADVVVAIGSDLDGTMTQNWRMPAAARSWSPSTSTPPTRQELPARPAWRRRRARGTEELLARGSRRARARRRWPAGWRICDAGVRSDLARATRRSSSSSTRSRVPCPRTPSWSCDMCIPGYWLGGVPPAAGAAAAPLPAGLGHARLRVPAGDRRRAGRRRADGERVGRRRLPLRRAASWRPWRRRGYR